MAEVLCERPRAAETSAELLEDLRRLNVPTEEPRVSQQLIDEDTSPRNHAWHGRTSENPANGVPEGTLPDMETKITARPTSDPFLTDDQASIYSNATTIRSPNQPDQTAITPRVREDEAQSFVWGRQDLASGAASQLTMTEYDRASIRSAFRPTPYAPGNRDAILPNRQELESIQGVLDSMQSSMSIRSNATKLETNIKAALDAGMSPEAGFRWRGIRHECYDQGTPLLLIITAMSRFTNVLLATAQLLLSRGANPDSPDDHWRRPLMKAAKWNASLVPLLLHHGANPNIQKGDKAPPLFRAATSEVNGREVVGQLLEAGADLQCTDVFGRNVLHYFFLEAAYRPNNIDNARLLIERGARIDPGPGVVVTPYDLGAKLDPSRRHRGASLNPWRRQDGYDALMELIKPSPGS